MSLIINFTPTGMIPTKEMTPHVPVSVQEIVDDVHAASELGITMVHLHAREVESGVPTYDPKIYGDIINGIRRFTPELVICVSLSGRNYNEFDKRAAPLSLDGDLKPDMGSLTLSSLNFPRTASSNSPDMIQQLAEEMKKRGIVPELEAFDAGMINYAKYLEKKAFIEPPYYLNILFGNIASAQADLAQIGVMLHTVPDNTLVSLAGIGAAQLPVNAIAVAMGLGVRVGLEDNIWYDTNRCTKASNLELLERVHKLAALHQRRIMSSAELREKLNLQPGYGEYGRRCNNITALTPEAL